MTAIFYNIITVLFTGAIARHIVSDAVANHAAVRLYSMHQMPTKMKSEQITLIIPRNTERRLCDNLRHIRDKGHCQIDTYEYAIKKESLVSRCKHGGAPTGNWADAVLNNMGHIGQFLEFIQKGMQ